MQLNIKKIIDVVMPTLKKIFKISLALYAVFLLFFIVKALMIDNKHNILSDNFMDDILENIEYDSGWINHDLIDLAYENTRNGWTKIVKDDHRYYLLYVDDNVWNPSWISLLSYKGKGKDRIAVVDAYFYQKCKAGSIIKPSGNEAGYFKCSEDGNWLTHTQSIAGDFPNNIDVYLGGFNSSIYKLYILGTLSRLEQLHTLSK